MKIINKYTVIIILWVLTFSYLGCKKDSVHFDYLRPSKGDTTTLIGLAGTERGDSAANSVFIDLSKEVQTDVARSSWDLGFYCGTDDFRVIINNSYGATAVGVDKGMAAVTAADSSANEPALTLNKTTGTASTVDLVTGDSTTYIKGTVIESISANDASNKTYIIKRGNDSRAFNTKLQLRAILVRITRATNGYNVTYGPLGVSSFSTVLINKDASYNFKYLSFNSATATVEPSKLLWDFEYGATTYTNGTNPVFRSDFVMINFMGGVKAAQIMTATKSFADFAKADLANVTWLGTRDVIGTNWFNVKASDASAAPGGSLPVYSDRFYVIKDAKGNVYKLSFAGGGGRGKPIIQYVNLIDNEPKNAGE